MKNEIDPKNPTINCPACLFNPNTDQFGSSHDPIIFPTFYIHQPIKYYLRFACGRLYGLSAYAMLKLFPKPDRNRFIISIFKFPEISRLIAGHLFY